MPEATSDRTDLKSQYAAQVTADLENNTKEQERIGTEIAALHGLLTDLERDHELLLGMRQAITAGAATEVQGSGTARGTAGTSRTSGRLPAARKAVDADAPGRKSSRRTKPARTIAARKSASGGATLRELIGALLAAHDEPRSAAEVTTALAQSHPEREVSPTVVRNTLEALVAKGRAHRSKQQKSVFYSAAESEVTAK